MSRRWIRLHCCLALVMLASGCAHVGRDFAYEKRSQLAIGSTTPDIAVALFGDPHKTLDKTNEDGAFRVFQYLHAYGNLAGSNSRVLIIEFKGNLLNAFIYASGFAEDATDFNQDAYAGIERGRHTRDDVRRLLGEPRGRAMCPSILEDFTKRCEGAKEVWGWVFTSGAKGLDASTIKSKSVFVTFDANGIVVEADLQQQI